MQEAERRQLWAQWKQEFKKTYKDKPDEDARYKVFEDKLNSIAEHNVDESQTFWLGLNQFSDMPFEEFKEKVLIKEPPPADPSDISLPPPPGTGIQSNNASTNSNRRLLYAGSVDWKAAGKVTSVKNQGDCGACWAFSSTAAMESLMLINYGTTINLSEQQLVDCTYSHDGCIGGLAYEAFEYLYGADQIGEANYGYRAAYSSSCRYDLLEAAKMSEKAQLFTEPGYIKAETWSLTSQLNAMSKQPIAMSVQASPLFQSYGGGIFDGPDCIYTGEVATNHAVLAFGYDVTAGVDASTSYIAFKNSWGENWGSLGFGKIRTCHDGCVGYCYTNYRASYPTSTLMPGVGDLTTTKVYSTYTTTGWSALSAEYLRVDQCASLCFYTYSTQCSQFIWLDGYIFDQTTYANCRLLDYKAVLTNAGANYGAVTGRVASRIPAAAPPPSPRPPPPRPPPPSPRPPPPRPPPPPATYMQETSTAYALTTVSNEVFKNTTSATNCLNDCLATATCSVYVNSGTLYMTRASPTTKFNCYLATAKVSYSYKSLTGYTSGKVASRMPA